MVAVHFTVVAVLKSATLVIGALITYFAFRAYRRTGARALRALAIGFAIVTLGSLLAGVVDQFVQVDPRVALVVESAFTTVGFGVILYSLYVD
ncbi:hypothetical protein BRD00_10640 [Halobacteriales archaeon QS_8_69_26]|nr:MAG: hypothetical protein BRD00_10640 [Halobacteriales archaeon QS_8_69_26]